MLYFPQKEGGARPPRTGYLQLAREIKAYMGQAEKWPDIGPITMNLDETKWDRIPPMSRTFMGRSCGRWEPNWGILSLGGGGPMYSIVYPD